MEPIISLKNLTYLNVFNNFSISFPKQKFIAISGPNNCGKTTLIRILSGNIFKGNALICNKKNLEEENLDDYFKLVKEIIPEELTFFYNNLEEESLSFLTKENKETYTKLLKAFSLSKIKKTAFKDLDTSTLIKIKLLLLLLEEPKVLLLDDIGLYFTKEEFSKILKTLQAYQKEKKLTIIMTTSNLEETIYLDYLYIITKNTIFLEGKPLEVLEKDNILNKIGLPLPFMIDLSVKLKDYDLVKKIELDMDRMVDELWK